MEDARGNDDKLSRGRSINWRLRLGRLGRGRCVDSRFNDGRFGFERCSDTRFSFGRLIFENMPDLVRLGNKDFLRYFLGEVGGVLLVGGSSGWVVEVLGIGSSGWVVKGALAGGSGHE